jgi:hypothetical protein
MNFNSILNLKNQTNKFVILIVFIFLSSLSISLLISNFTTSKSLNAITQKMIILRENYNSFKNYYGSFNLPSTEMKGLVNNIVFQNSLIEEIEKDSSNLNPRQSLNIKSLVNLYKEKNIFHKKVVDNFIETLELYNDKKNYSEVITKLLENEKYKLNYIDLYNNNDFYIKRIDYLRNIGYNLDNKIFSNKAKSELKQFIEYFSTYHINYLSPIEKNILAKEKEIFKNN